MRDTFALNLAGQLAGYQPGGDAHPRRSCRPRFSFRKGESHEKRTFFQSSGSRNFTASALSKRDLSCLSLIPTRRCSPAGSHCGQSSGIPLAYSSERMRSE